MDARVHDVERGEADRRAGRVERHAYVALLPLDERRDERARARNRVELVAVDVRGENRVVHVQVVCMALAREIAGRRKAIGMGRVREPHNGIGAVRSQRELRDLENGVAAHGLRPEVDHLHGLAAARPPVERNRTPARHAMKHSGHHCRENDSKAYSHEPRPFFTFVRFPTCPRSSRRIEKHRQTSHLAQEARSPRSRRFACRP